MDDKFSKIAVLLCFLVFQAFTSGAQTVTKVASCEDANHNLFLKSDGSLWVMGYKNFGQLGDGKSSQTNRPE